MTFGPGAVIAGRYHADRLVGAGGMGEVWAGELVANASISGTRGPAQPGQKVALKRLLPAASQHHEVVARFRREAVLLGRIQSEYVARVYDFVDDPTFGPVLVMEFIDGPSLAHILEDRKLDVVEAIDLAVDLALALCDLHDAKIVHRDLKPGNIIMRPEPDGSVRAIIVDFGIGRQLTSADSTEEITGITKANIALGTVEYMAPEQILNSREVTPVTDIYAIGAILYRAIAGVHAFGARRGEVLARAKLIEDPPKLDAGDDDVARELSDIVGKCLKKRPAQRFASAKDLHAAVKRLQDRVRIAALDLDSTTADGSRTRVVEGMRDAAPMPQPPQSRTERTDRVPVMQPVAPSIAGAGPPPSTRDVRASISEVRMSDPRASQPDPRSSLSGAEAFAPPVSPGRAPMPSIPEGRASMPSISDARMSLPGVAASAQAAPPQSRPDGRAPFASIPDSGGYPRSMVEPAQGRGVGGRGVGAVTMSLAVLAAFAVGGALGVVFAPAVNGDKTSSTALASAAAGTPACPVCPAASQSAALAQTTASAVAAASSSALAAGSSSSAPGPSAAQDAASANVPPVVHPQDPSLSAGAGALPGGPANAPGAPPGAPPPAGDPGQRPASPPTAAPQPMPVMHAPPSPL